MNHSYQRILIDTGPLVAFYDEKDRFHHDAKEFMASCTSELVTTVGCVAEVVWLLSSFWKVQNEFLIHLSEGLYTCEALLSSDFARIAELNEQYADLPGDFADLAIVSISERLNIAEIATIDRDFNVYRRYRKQPFNRVFWT